MSKHFKLTSNTKIYEGKTLYQIEATTDLCWGVSVGTLGGFIEKVDNLQGVAWVNVDSVICGDACVSGNAWIGDYAVIKDNAEVRDSAMVYGNAKVSGYSQVSNNAKVFYYADISGYAKIYDDASVSGYVKISERAKVYNKARLFGLAEVGGDVYIHGNVNINEQIKLDGSCSIDTPEKLAAWIAGRQLAGWASIYLQPEPGNTCSFCNLMLGEGRTCEHTDFIVCECGAEKTGSSGHSHWCAKYTQ